MKIHFYAPNGAKPYNLTEKETDKSIKNQEQVETEERFLV